MSGASQPDALTAPSKPGPFVDHTANALDEARARPFVDVLDSFVDELVGADHSLAEFIERHRRARDAEAFNENPLAAAEVARYACVLRRLLRALGREVVETALIGEGESDLLRSERREVDRLRELLDGRVLMPLQLNGDRGRALAVLDSFEDQLTPAAEAHDREPTDRPP